MPIVVIHGQGVSTAKTAGSLSDFPRTITG